MNLGLFVYRETNLVKTAYNSKNFKRPWSIETFFKHFQSHIPTVLISAEPGMVLNLTIHVVKGLK